MFYLNVRTIPANEKGSEDKNVLRLIFKTRLKLFFRPAALAGTPGETCKNLSFSRNGNQLVITNGGAYYSVFDSLQLGTTRLDNIELVAPESQAQFALPASASGNRVSWRCVTDYGNASAAFSAALQAN